jgi:hypothetical protein
VVAIFADSDGVGVAVGDELGDGLTVEAVMVAAVVVAAEVVEAFVPVSELDA